MKDSWWNAVSDILPGLLFGWIFLLVWLVVLIPKIKWSKKKKRLKEEWVKREGMVTEISHNMVRINDQRWYVVIAIYEWKLFRSEAVYADIYYLVEEWDEIDIYVGSWWEEDYRVDTDSLFYREPKPSYYERSHSIWDVFNIIKDTIRNNKTNY